MSNQPLSYKNLRNKLIIAFSFIVIVVTILSLASYWFVYRAESKLRQFTETNFQEVIAAYKTDYILATTESNLRELMLETDSVHSEEVILAQKTIKENAFIVQASLKTWLSAMSSELAFGDYDEKQQEKTQIDKLKKLKPLIDDYFNQVALFLKYYQRGDFHSVDNVFESKLEPLYRTLFQNIHEIRLHSINEVNSDLKKIKHEMLVSVLIGCLGVFFVFFLAIIFGYILSNLLAKYILHYTNQIEESQSKLSHIAYHDMLTGLPNRYFFNKQLHHLISKAKRHNDIFVLLMIDIDCFKSVNDTYGHQTGDQLLQNTASRLIRSLRDVDFVSRVGGDEFAVIVSDIQEPEEADLIAKKLLKTLSAPYVIDRQRIDSFIGIGISNYPVSAKSAEGLIKNADMALYYAKQKGRNNYQLFTAEMGEKHQERLRTYNYLYEAIRKNQLFLVYQPVFSVKGNKIKGMEALLRWQHPILGLVLPETFILLAEKRGLMVKIGRWVLRRACEEFSEIYSHHPNGYKLFVNLSLYQITEDFIEDLKKILNETGVSPQQLELEITETAMMSSLLDLEAMLEELSQLGIQFAIDDFGTGYSSLSRLHSLPINTLKIDKLFIQNITKGEDDLSLVTTMLALAKKLKLDVIAEGVETKQQLKLLMEKGCPSVQGFYFSKPVTTQEIQKLLEQYNNI